MHRDYPEIALRHITVAVPVERIDAAIRSVAQQTYHNFDVILECDAALLQDLQAELARGAWSFECRVVGNQLGGLSFAPNLGLHHARGDFIARWDANDLCDLERFERQMAAFDRDHALGVVDTRVTLIDEHGTPNPGHQFCFFLEIAKFAALCASCATRAYDSPILVTF